jgi:hypothetical protein
MAKAAVMHQYCHWQQPLLPGPDKLGMANWACRMAACGEPWRLARKATLLWLL